MSASVEPRRSLLDCLREDLRLHGTHAGCEHGSCGCCNVLLDGEVVRACLLLAVQADGATVTTVEGLESPTGLSPLQEAFCEFHALQCGYCTPGMLITLTDLLDHTPQPSDAEIVEAISGNLCRCTGYQQISPGHARGRRPEPRVTEPARTFRYIGKPFPINEDRRFVRGRGHYIADLELPGMLHLGVASAPVAHARLRGVDVEAARRAPGVVAVFTGQACWPGPSR